MFCKPKELTFIQGQEFGLKKLFNTKNKSDKNLKVDLNLGINENNDSWFMSIHGLKDKVILADDSKDFVDQNPIFMEKYTTNDAHSLHDFFSTNEMVELIKTYVQLKS